MMTLDETVIYNAVGPSLAKASDWLKFTARRNLARDVLAALKANNLMVIPTSAVARVRADGAGARCCARPRRAGPARRRAHPRRSGSDRPYPEGQPVTVPQPLKRASIRLLVRIAAEDQGEGVVFRPAGRGRLALDGADFAVNRETFRVPSMHRLIAIEYPETGVWKVRLTDAGRDYLDRYEARRPAARKASR
ncbi:hypothetical protein ACFQYP_00670 [Nonomuraea antimicrobica]